MKKYSKSNHYNPEDTPMTPALEVKAEQSEVGSQEGLQETLSQINK